MIKRIKLKPKTSILFISAFFLLVFLYFFSYFFFIGYFKDLEFSQNGKNIEYAVQSIDNNIDNLKKTSKDYALWDDTYNFIKDGNKDYIYENFREGTDTLKDLDISFMIFANNKDIVMFSIKNKNFKDIDLENLQKDIIPKFSSNKEVGTLYKFDDKIYYLVKTAINNSDSTLQSNGYLIFAKLLDFENLKTIVPNQIGVNIANKKYTQNDYNFSKRYLKDVKVKVFDINKKISNIIQFYDLNYRFLFSIDLEFETKIINRGHKVLLIFNSVITVLLILVFFLIHKQEKLLEKYSDELDSEVEEKTLELREALEVLEKRNNELFILANQDMLTKINNRRRFFTLSISALEHAKKEKKEITIVMIDIDNFKSINDTYGHEVGDRVLVHFSEHVNDIIGKNAIFGRLGGEEFAITILENDFEKAVGISEKIRLSIERAVLHINGIKIVYTASFGLCSSEGLSNIDEILQKADKLLYKAKHRGKNCVVRN